MHYECERKAVLVRETRHGRAEGIDIKEAPIPTPALTGSGSKGSSVDVSDLAHLSPDHP